MECSQKGLEVVRDFNIKIHQIKRFSKSKLHRLSGEIKLQGMLVFPVSPEYDIAFMNKEIKRFYFRCVIPKANIEVHCTNVISAAKGPKK